MTYSHFYVTWTEMLQRFLIFSRILATSSVHLSRIFMN